MKRKDDGDVVRAFNGSLVPLRHSSIVRQG